jgi:cytoskeletal protein CcmA (bactofilin family)
MILKVPTVTSDFAIIGQDSVFISAQGKIKGDETVASNGTLTLLGYASIEGITHSIGAVELASKAKILNNVTTNSTLKTGQRCMIDGDVNAGNDVTLGANTKVIGDVISAKGVYWGPYVYVKGAIIDFGSPNSATAVSLPTCTVDKPGTDDRKTPKNSGPHTVPTGAHKNYTYGISNKVIFEGGDYSFENLYFGAQTNIVFKGKTTIHISKELGFSHNVKQTLIGVNPEEVIYTLAPKIFATIGTRSTIYGTFCAPGSEVLLMNNVSLKGAVYAKTVKVGKYSTITSAPADPADLP